MRGKLSALACELARSQVSLRLDGELSEFEDVELTAHLAGCAACRAYETDVVAITQTVQTTPLEALATPVVLPRRLRPSLARWQVGTTAAAVAVVALGSFLGLSRGHNVLRPSLGISAYPEASRSAARPAYLDSSDYERRLIQAALDMRHRARTGGEIAV